MCPPRPAGQTPDAKYHPPPAAAFCIERKNPSQDLPSIVSLGSSLEGGQPLARKKIAIARTTRRLSLPSPACKGHTSIWPHLPSHGGRSRLFQDRIPCLPTASTGTRSKCDSDSHPHCKPLHSSLGFPPQTQLAPPSDSGESVLQGGITGEPTPRPILKSPKTTCKVAPAPPQVVWAPPLSKTTGGRP